MGYKLKTAPASEPVTLAEAKLHLKIDSDTSDDDLINNLITAAREQAEKFTGRALINQTWELKMDAFPTDDDDPDSAIVLQMPPLSSVSSIYYLHAETGVNTQLSAANVYDLDTYQEPGRIILRYGQTWPAVYSVPNAIVVTFIAGYGSTASSVPSSIKAAILLIIGHLYENREDVLTNRTPYSLPKGANDLLAPYCISKFV
jgi:uncharacterized phiE125 gp8 family phage protein